MDRSARTLLTKKDLARIFGLISASGRTIYYKKLRELYFTDSELQKIDISPQEYDEIKGGKPFNHAQTSRIITNFKITAAELAVN